MGAAASVEGENNEIHDPNEDYVVEPPSCKCCNSFFSYSSKHLIYHFL